MATDSKGRLKTESKLANMYLANRGEKRYLAQLAMDTPACLKNLQDYTVKAFYYDWKGYEYFLNGDRESAAKYFDLSTQVWIMCKLNWTR